MRNSKIVVFYALLAMMLATTNAIAAAEWMPGLSVAGWVAVAGLVAGVALSMSNFPGWTAHLTSWMYGTFVVGFAAGLSQQFASGLGWRDRILAMGQRISDVIYQATHRGLSRETLHFFLIVCGVTWLFSYAAAWYTYRQNRVWHVVLPTGFVLFCNVYYYSGKNNLDVYLAVYLLAVIVLLVNSFVSSQEEVWREQRVRYASNLRGILGFAGMALGAVALLLAWQMPDLAQGKSAQDFFSSLNQPYSETQQEIGRLFSGIRNYNIKPSEEFSSDLVLGGPRDLPTDPVMSVVARDDLRNYWRARSFDTYDGSRWRNTFIDFVDTAANKGTVTVTGFISRTQVTAQFQLARGTDSLYTTGQPLNASVNSQMVVNGPRTAPNEIVQIRVAAPLQTGATFSSIGTVSTAEVEKLRRAPTTYPAWVSQKYLTVPATVPRRVRDLAAQVTSNDHNAFDKAVSIEQYLRKNLVYDENIPAPPAGVEASDYVLFNIKRAYCTYYATAMTMMLRAQGIPARLVEGFAQGTPQPGEFGIELTSFTVLQKDRHAWVEAFFPNYGWVTFEPTAGQSPITRSSEPVAVATAAATPTPQPTPTLAPGEKPQATAVPKPVNGQPPNTPGSTGMLADALGILASIFALLVAILPFALGLALLVGFCILGLRYMEQQGLASYAPVAKAYAVLSRWASWLGIGASVTPFEQAQELARRAPRAESQTRSITEQYVARKFGPPDQDEGSADDPGVMRALGRALREFRLTWLLRRLGIRR